ncbi:MAG: GNAT family N-acetyltransferase [Coriobacteriia bacterium]|nr:GNAT family N-acetyltransferase [Coriobacteriia bacterium]
MEVKAIVTLRPAAEDDLACLNAYCYAEGMDNLPGIENVTVAADADNDAVAFMRLAFSPAGIAHVNPIVVNPYWRGRGIGRLLTEDALERYGELRLVSRGASVPFYRALGFAEIPWEDIAPGVTDDCACCELREECNPLPMRAVR